MDWKEAMKTLVAALALAVFITAPATGSFLRTKAGSQVSQYCAPQEETSDTLKVYCRNGNG
jgi:hypothetical protein